MKKMIALMAALAVCSLLWAGCATKKPRAEVPPPKAEVPPPASTDEMRPADQDETKPWPKDYQPPSEAPDARADFNRETLARFALAYPSAGRPRIAVFLNRQVSDDVREWATDERSVVDRSETSNTEESEKKTGEQGEDVAGEKKQGTKHTVRETSYRQRYIGVEGKRPDPEEAWMWAFEDGFLQPFLRSGAVIVDRAVIMRLTAADSGKQGDAYDPMAVKKIEIEALRNHVDLFVELLVTRSPGSAYGYEFKATAKSIKNGVVAGHASSLRWDQKKKTKQAAAPTSQGYVYKEVEADLPPVHQVSGDLAVDLMDSLMNGWGVPPEKPAVEPGEAPASGG